MHADATTSKLPSALHRVVQVIVVVLQSFTLEGAFCPERLQACVGPSASDAFLSQASSRENDMITKIPSPTKVKSQKSTQSFFPRMIRTQASVAGKEHWALAHQYIMLAVG